MSYKITKETIIFNIIGYISITVIAIFCVLPFLLVISGSLTSEKSIYLYGYGLLPKDLSLEAYRVLFKVPEKILRAYGVTIFLTLAGTACGLFITSMTAYVLYRKDFKYRNYFAFFFYFTTLFNGGLISTYIIMVRYLHLKNSYLALVLPGMIHVFHILIMRNFMNGSIPDALSESAKIDGAGDFRIFRSIALPLMTPALASIGLFIALYYWNDWSHAMLYISREKKYPLQYLLYRMISSASYAGTMAADSGVPIMEIPEHSLKLAMTVIATGPIIFAYPFVQKYFIRGITIGAIKG